MKTASPEQKARWNERKQQMILQRKQQALTKLSKEIGVKLKAQTVCLIANPDTKTVDVYRFNGFHLRVGWKSPQAARGYAGSYRYA